MSAEINDGGPAFPRLRKLDNQFNKPWVAETVGGMTLRDWFAGQALLHHASLITIGDDHEFNRAQMKVLARLCFEQADAMLKAREAQS